MVWTKIYKKHLRSISGSNWRNFKTHWFCLGKRVSWKKKRVIDVFKFLDNVVKEIYEKNEIQKCFLFQNVADTDSTFLFFIFISKLSSSLNKKTARNIIFEVLTKRKVFIRLDLTKDFWEQFNVRSRSLKKQFGLYEVGNINNTNILMIAINNWADLHTKIQKKNEFLALESRAAHLCERLRVLRSIYAQSPLPYLLNSPVLMKIKFLKSRRELIIIRSWK